LKLMGQQPPLIPWGTQPRAPRAEDAGKPVWLAQISLALNVCAAVDACTSHVTLTTDMPVT
jgi:hypothetical protein